MLGLQADTFTENVSDFMPPPPPGPEPTKPLPPRPPLFFNSVILKFLLLIYYFKISSVFPGFRFFTVTFLLSCFAIFTFLLFILLYIRQC